MSARGGEMGVVCRFVTHSRRCSSLQTYGEFIAETGKALISGPPTSVKDDASHCKWHCVALLSGGGATARGAVHALAHCEGAAVSSMGVFRVRYQAKTMGELLPSN